MKKYLSATKLIEQFELDVSPETLRRHVREKYFTIGKEVIDISQKGAKRPTYKFNPEACLKKLGIPAELR